MRYFPGPRKVRELVHNGVIGRPLVVNYYTGQYLPDWHPWERIEDFYVSTRATGGGREIVPFELTWLNGVFGTPTPRGCVKAKLTDMLADIDDAYSCLISYDCGAIMSFTVEVISRPMAARELRVTGSTGEIVYSADEGCVRWATTSNPEWTRYPLGGGTIEAGYINPEEPYIAEMRDFLAAAQSGNTSCFPNTLLDDYQVLQTLYQLEAQSGGVE
jgi:predicted dehydrogenase